MNKDELLKEIEDDLNITPENIEVKMYEVSGLHSKYLRHFFNTKLKLNKKQKELNILYSFLYYKIKDDSDDLMNQKEIIFNIMGNDEYSKLNYEVQVLTDFVDILDRTVKKVNSLSFDVKNIIEYNKYLQGNF